MRAARECRRFQFQGTQLFSQGAKQGISLLVLMTYLTLISAPAAAAMRQEVFGRPKPLTENSIAQSQLAQMRETMRQFKLEQRLTPAPTGTLEKLKGLFTDTPQVKAERALAETLLAAKAKLLSEAGEQDAAMAATRAQLLQKQLLARILARHDAAVLTIQQRRAELLSTLEQLQQAQARDNSGQRQQLLNDLDKKLEQWGGEHAAKTDFKHLPWGSPSNKVRAPHDSEFAYLGHLEMFGIKPLQLAYAGSMPVPPGTVLPILPKIGEAVQPADLAANEDVQLTPAIQAQAAALHHNPSEIYRWVHDSIEFIPTYGSIQGADYTLQTKRGNAFDTSSLLIALLRASNIPARYVYGTVEVPIAQAMNWVGGVTNPDAVLNLMGQGGIPNIGLTQGGKIVAVRLEHVWVEAFIDFVPSRGVVNKVPDTWIPLDASFKQYTYTAPLDLKAAVPFDAQALITDVQSSATIDEAQGYVQNVDQTKIQTALTNYQAQVQNYLTTQQPNATVGDVLGTKTIQPYPIKLLSQTLPLKLVTAAADFQTLPDTMRHYLDLKMFQSPTEVALDEPALSAHISTPKLAGKSLALSFKPATQADVDTLNSFMPQPHSDGTPIQPSELPSVLPGYLVNLTPEITIDGQTVASGGEYMLGQEVTAYIGFKSPANEQPVVEKLLRAGEYHALGVDLQGMSSAQVSQLQARLNSIQSKLQSNQLSGLSKHDLAGSMLQLGAQSYFAINDSLDNIAASTAGVINYRAPSFGTFSTNLTPDLRFGFPLSVRSSGVMMDIDRLQRQAIEKGNDFEKTKSFVLSQGSRQSANEHLIPEKLFSTESQPSSAVSAVKALQIAVEQGQKIFVINQSNISTVLPQITHKAAIGDDIINAVNAGKVVTISQNDIGFLNWSGTGYVITDPATGASAFMIGGGADGAWASAGQFMDSGGAIVSLFEFWEKGRQGDPFYEFSALTECLKKVAAVAGVVVDTLALTEQGCNAGASLALSAILTIVSEIIMQAAVAVAFNPALIATGGGALLVIGLAIGLVMGLKTMATDLFTLTCDARRPA